MHSINICDQTCIYRWWVCCLLAELRSDERDLRCCPPEFNHWIMWGVMICKVKTSKVLRPQWITG